MQGVLPLIVLAFEMATTTSAATAPYSPTRVEPAKKRVPPSCDSPVYCYGTLLHTVQLAEVFNDSKHFVDMEMRADQAVILANFKTFMDTHNQRPSREQVTRFVNTNFVDSNELNRWSPPDYQEKPPLLGRITSDEVREFAKKIIAIWPQLGRRISNETLANIQRHSLLPVTQGFIIPGGRFRETYYWDSYWIIKGLLLSGMSQTAKGMLDNFVTLVKRFGYIPNGARVYYARRSQPPLFALMVREYIKATSDTYWLRENIQHVETEVAYWLRERLQPIGLARYYPISRGPRPESYKEDFRTAAALATEALREELYVNLKGGAESGWDYSSRWFYDTAGGNNANLSGINMARTIPVDLNSFLYGGCNALCSLYAQLGNKHKSMEWKRYASALKSAINNLLFNEEDGMWYDYDTSLKRHRKQFSVSNISPLWVNAQPESFKPDRLLATLQNYNIFEYHGGTPSTVKQTGEQWDLPNAWPPLQAIMIQSLERAASKQAKDMAEKLARRWVSANMIGYDRTEYMFEKYDAITPGQYGGGGEYEVQSGFGWTNGVVLELINDYYTKRRT